MSEICVPGMCPFAKVLPTEPRVNAGASSPSLFVLFPNAQGLDVIEGLFGSGMGCLGAAMAAAHHLRMHLGKQHMNFKPYLALLAWAALSTAQAADCVIGTPYTAVGPVSCTVPLGVISLDVVVIGGGGGGGHGLSGPGVPGGHGARISVASYAVVPGATLDMYVGGGGQGAYNANMAVGGGGGASSQINPGQAIDPAR
jgi:hypothetical protein